MLQELRLVFVSLQKKSKGSIRDLFLYFVHILIWYVSPDLNFFFKFIKNFSIRLLG